MWEDPRYRLLEDITAELDELQERLASASPEEYADIKARAKELVWQMQQALRPELRGS